MKRGLRLAAALLLVLAAAGAGWAGTHPTDTFSGPGGEVKVTCLGHASLLLAWKGKVVALDPWSKVADYHSLPKADLVLITHHHYDHLDPAAVSAISGPGTVIIGSPMVVKSLGRGRALANGQSARVFGIGIKAVPAYNLVHKRPSGEPWHVKGQGNGYVLDFGGTRVYVAGDTELVPEMKNLGRLDAAFLPVLLPYTMDPAMAAKAARLIAPKVLYPYHMGKMANVRPTTEKLRALLKDAPGIEVRMLPFGIP